MGTVKRRNVIFIGYNEKGAIMKILIYQWKSYNQKDVISAFEKANIQVETFSFTMTNFDNDPKLDELLSLKLKTYAFDFVFSINYFTQIALTCHNAAVPYVCWNVDSPLISMFHKSIFLDTNLIFTFDKTEQQQFSHAGVKNIYHLPLASNVSRLNTLLSHKESLSIYESELSFVGDLYQRNEYDDIAKNLPEYLLGYLDAVINAQLLVTSGNIIEPMLSEDILDSLSHYYTLEKDADSFSNLKLVFANTILGYKVACITRTSYLCELAKIAPLFIYTKSHLDGLPLLISKGIADYETQMPKIFHESKINLNFTIPNIKSGIPLRVFDVLSSFGFLLTNPQEEILEYFIKGKDLDVFENLEDCKEKVRFYLKNDNIRISIAKNAYEKVNIFHTLDQRIEKIISIFTHFSS